MTFSKDDKRQIIMDYYLNPRFKKENIDKTNSHYLHSNNCVDEIWINLKIEDNILKNAEFEAIGCAVFLSSTDIFLEIAKNKTIDEIKLIVENYDNLIHKKSENIKKNILEKLLVFEDVKTHLNRLECANMISKIVKIAIDKG
ncbi:iron-sulfur cluster assembly scaffold protein [Mesomycoplasma neurolyticum]|uniref:Aminotransferase protein U-like protein n=1 Tax=Mesomycoplasma neurolyticum TaxID=2120 RepID=A0A449A4U8_9BACT|nr:iron-sulfur cluster assembly scaffold protein [Mesomycoplasma neurolyticum]VEU59310.1 aminotransferase protein U-like protein [Mesomycoplasma neurolyticum]